MAHDAGGQAGLPWWLYALDKARPASLSSCAGTYRLISQTNAIVTSLTACFILYTRSAGAAYFAAGAVFCSLTVKVLKRCVRQPRPVVVNGRRKKTYGCVHSSLLFNHCRSLTGWAAGMAGCQARTPRSSHTSRPTSPSPARTCPYTPPSLCRLLCRASSLC